MKSPWTAVIVVAAIAFLQMTQAKSDEPGKAPPPAADQMLGKEAGQVRDDNGLKMKLVWCPPGRFQMENVEVRTHANGTDQKAPNDDEVVNTPAPVEETTRTVIPIKVFISRGYWLGKFEVTQREWMTVMATEPWKEQRRANEGIDIAATYINWHDAMEFCSKLTTQERKADRLPGDWEYTLPSEAQWERACRARTTSQFNFGNDESKLGEFAWCRKNAWDAGEMYAHRVGQKRPNAWGLFDMHGNAYEWCRDDHADKVPGGTDPEVTKMESNSKVIRGGCWSSIPAICRSAHRHSNHADDGDWYLGFRVALKFVSPAE
jgi:formylglycine-generating enzyme required for sulfatase activity